MLIALISCVASKSQVAAAAKDMYTSPLFKGAYRYAKKLGAERIFILSAKYGLVPDDKVIEPYNETLNTKGVGEIKQWANNVLAELAKVADLQNDKFIILAGMKYRKYLVGGIKHFTVPLKGKPIGKQLAFYKGEFPNG